MKLQTTGSLQVHGFRRKIKTGNMKLMLKDPQDKTAPEFYMKDAQKKFWRKLSSAERKKTIKKADIQCQKSDFYGTFQGECRACTGTFQKQRKGYRTDRIRDAPFSAQENPIQTDRGQDIREEKRTEARVENQPIIGQAGTEKTKGENASVNVGETQNNPRIFQTQMGWNDNISRKNIEKVGNNPISADETHIAVKAAKETARIVKQNFSAAMRKEEEERKFNYEAILTEEGSIKSISVHSEEMGIQKAVSAMIAAIAVVMQAAFSAILPFLMVILLVISLLAGILSFLFGGVSSGYAKANVSAECEQYRPLVTEYAAKYGMQNYVELLLAVMMQESGGLLPDVMQAAEGGFNTRYPHVPNGIPDPEYSIECGVQELKRALELAGCQGPTDMEHIKLALQGYNYGEGYITWALSHYNGYSEENAAEFSDMMAAKMGWSAYGDKKYVEHVLRYYTVVSGGFADTPAGGMSIPLYDQKDYPDVPFGGGSIATSGCAPTSFAMVASYLLGRQVTPVDAMRWCGNAYYVPGIGTGWDYFYGAASYFGIRIIEETMDPQRVLQALAAGKPVISSQNPGLFTGRGHFIVLRGVTADGKVLINDPNDSPGKNYASREFDMLREVNATSAKYWIFDR